MTVSLQEAGNGDRDCTTPLKCGYSQGNDEDASDVTFTFTNTTTLPVGRTCPIVPPAVTCDLKVPCTDDDDSDAAKCTFNCNETAEGEYVVPFKMDYQSV